MSNSIFLEFFLWLCLLIKAHGNNMSCDVVKRGRSCYFHEWNLRIWNYLFLPLFYHVCLNWHLFYMCGYFWILSTALHGALLQGKRVIHACRWSSRYTWTEWMDWKHSKHIINFAMLFSIKIFFRLTKGTKDTKLSQKFPFGIWKTCKLCVLNTIIYLQQSTAFWMHFGNVITIFTNLIINHTANIPIDIWHCPFRAFFLSLANRCNAS